MPGLVPGIFSFALAVAYVPGILSASEAGRWALLSVGVPLAVATYVKVPKSTFGHLLGALLLAWAATSMFWTASRYDGVDELWKWAVYAGLFHIGATTASLRPVYIGLGLGMAVNGALAVAQYYGFDGVMQVAAPAGLFMNKNYLAEPAVLVLVALVGNGQKGPETGFRPFLLAASVLPAALVPGTRGALLALVAAVMMWLWPRSKGAALMLAAGGLAACVLVLHNSSVADRFNIWTDTLAGLTWFGRGIGSYFVAFPEQVQHVDLLAARPAHAHSDFLEIAFELGVPGLVLAMGFLAACLTAAGRTVERAILLAFLTEACFAFPLHNPVTGAIAALAAGHLCGARYSVRGDFVHWRMVFRAWKVAQHRSWRGGFGPETRAIHLPVRTVVSFGRRRLLFGGPVARVAGTGHRGDQVGAVR